MKLNASEGRSGLPGAPLPFREAINNFAAILNGVVLSFKFIIPKTENIRIFERINSH